MKMRMFKKGILTTVCASFILLGGTAMAGDMAAGKAAASKCVSCHGANGEGSGSTPKIAGLDAKAFTTHMTDFKSGKRKSMMMGMIAKGVSDEDIANLAAYFSSK